MTIAVTTLHSVQARMLFVPYGQLCKIPLRSNIEGAKLVAKRLVIEGARLPREFEENQRREPLRNRKGSTKISASSGDTML